MVVPLISCVGVAIALACCAAPDDSTGTPAASEGAVVELTDLDRCGRTDGLPQDASFDWIVRQDLDNGQIGVADLAVSPDSTIYILDADRRKVVHTDLTGRVLGEWGRDGEGPGEFRGPTAIAVDRNGSVYVADYPSAIHVFSKGGAPIRTISTPVTGIEDLAILDDRIVVARAVRKGDINSTRPYVQMLDSLGTPVVPLLWPAMHPNGSRPLIAPQHNEVRIATSVRGEVAIWYPLDHYVEVFTGTGKLVSKFSGCLPDEVRERYRQARDEPDQTSRIVTVAVSLDSSRIRIATFDGDGGAPTLRLREYTFEGRQTVARDIALPNTMTGGNGRYWNSDLILYSRIPGSGVARLRAN